MWDVTMATLAVLFVGFLIGFLALHLINRAAATRREERKTYDEERLDRRLEVAAAWYDSKFGPEVLRRQEKRVRIESYGDVETYELRGLYRLYEID